MAFVNSLARVALYLRAETLMEAFAQAALLQRAADGVPGWRIVAVFCALKLATGADWPGLDGAIGAARTGFDVLMVMGLDRLSRHSDELDQLITKLTADDVTVFTVHRPNGRQCDAEILAVDAVLMAVHRRLIAARRPARALPPGRPPTDGGRR